MKQGSPLEVTAICREPRSQLMSPGVLMKTKTVTVMILLLPLYMFKCSSALGMLLSARGQAWSWRGCVSAEQNSLVKFIYVSSLREGHRQVWEGHWGIKSWGPERGRWSQTHCRPTMGPKRITNFGPKQKPVLFLILTLPLNCRCSLTPNTNKCLPARRFHSPALSHQDWVQRSRI